jgi:glyoxylase-like metal-dependent hydrolase (beta-lactamase superfamily II)
MTHGYRAELKFYGGVEARIGGNIVALTFMKNGDNYTFFFDMGVHLPEYYKRTRSYKVEIHTLEQFQRWKLIPEFNNIGEVKACFISHAHSDHYLALPAFLNSAIRGAKVVWASNTTAKIIGDNRIRSFPLAKNPFENSLFYEDYALKRDGIHVKIAPFPTDHPILGSCAWIVEFKNQIIVYTGDFRDHGLLSDFLTRKHQFWTYVQKRARLRKKSVVVITEGTNYGTPEKFFTEKDLRTRLIKLLTNFKNELITILISERDLWRVLIINEALRSVKNRMGINRHIIYDEAIARLCRKVYVSFPDDYSHILTPSNLTELRDMLFVQKNQEISDEILRDASENPSKYIFLVTINKGFALLDQIAKRHVGGCCILSLSEHLGEATGVSISDYTREIAELGFNVEELHSSGHIFPNRLAQILKKIKAKDIFVIHSLAPEGLCKFIKARTGLNAVAPSLGESFELT